MQNIQSSKPTEKALTNHEFNGDSKFTVTEILKSNITSVLVIYEDKWILRLETLTLNVEQMKLQQIL